ncbi:DUF4234 domain-containing protein [Alkalimonas collagenimarina]|uniref:DUF4234 domain-containing protein n=2 Tax=Alkalimonas collagenimarina TaxID=400390 RepID=A0ABT9H2D0_9GAMM|nr:DUF4234 domain-containing protein [Alkalimonas collagenimarina]MDP4537479.1 DUF4234 domain-containing protein [Alkalimonas collagenimarina]
MVHINDIFETKSVKRTIALCVFTFGIYVIYRLFLLTRQVNRNVKEPISSWFVASAVSVHLISLFGLIIYFTAIGNPDLLLFSKLMHLVSSIFHITWLIKIRNRINLLTGVGERSKFWLNPVLSSFLHVIYFQYKINQLLQINSEQQQAECHSI